MKLGFTLNVCCGTDRTGDVLVDVDRRFKPTIVADVTHPPFRYEAFDTIICDPPYAMYNHRQWILDLAHHAKRRLILSSPKILLRLGAKWRREIWLTDTVGLFMRIWQVFTREDPREALNTVTRDLSC